MLRLSERIDGEGRITKYSYDLGGRLIEVAYDDGSRIENSYDSRGNLLHSTYGGWEAKYEYDALSRPTLVDYPFLEQQISLTWGPAAPAGRVVEASLVQSGTNVLDSKLTYDSAGRLASVQDEEGQVSFEYDPAGRLSEQIVPSDLKTMWNYDQAGRVTGIASTVKNEQPFSSLTYTYDLAGNVTSVNKEFGNDEFTDHFSYDSLDRLVSMGNETSATILLEIAFPTAL